MKKHAFAFMFSVQFALAGCASNGNQFGSHAILSEQGQQSRLNEVRAGSSNNPDTGMSARDTVETVQDITQTAREAKSTVYEVRRTLDELKGLMEGW
ncbi:hypothetical protein [Pseudomonas mangrovi]|uniref:hypothetical protein n=1 Tax=Pseudomonas mangrovi TaxID=2161748 RepID=UPI0011B1F2DB|nr:hypothetical protein [Pseudomonas mangrovi]